MAMLPQVVEQAETIKAWLLSQSFSRGISCSQRLRSGREGKIGQSLLDNSPGMKMMLFEVVYDIGAYEQNTSK